MIRSFERQPTACYFLRGYLAVSASGSENELGLVFAYISRVSAPLPSEEGIVLLCLKKPEVAVFRL
jgi:hypothetical protein